SATISAASLTLNLESNTSSTAGHVYRILRTDWDEASCTWVIYKTGSNWTTAGCGSDGNDYTTTGGVAYSALSGTGAKTISGLEGLAQDAYDNRGDKLHIMLKQDT